MRQRPGRYAPARPRGSLCQRCSGRSAAGFCHRWRWRMPQRRSALPPRKQSSAGTHRRRAPPECPQMVMGRRAMRKRQKPAQKIQLLLAKPGNVTNRLRPRQNRRKAHKQNFIQRIHHLAALAVIRKIPEMIKKYNNLRKVQTIVHRNPSKRIRGIRQIQRFMRLSSGFFTRLPCSKHLNSLQSHAGRTTFLPELHR